MYLTKRAIDELDRQRRAALINSLTGFKPANLIGTVDRGGQSNLAIMSSLVHIGSQPPLLALVFRPDSAERHTLSNIREVGEYTINHIHTEIIDAAHQTAARYPRETSEFAATGLREEWRDGCAAPFVAQSRVRLAMALREEQLLAINGTHLVIGEVMTIELPDAALNESGALNPDLAGTVAISGLDSYHRAQTIQRMAYAKAHRPPARLAG